MERLESNNNGQIYKFDFLFFKRFFRLASFMFPAFVSVPVLLCMFLLCLSLLEQVVINRIGFLPSEYYTILGNKDEQSFKDIILKTFLFILTEAFLSSTISYVTSILHIWWRQKLTVSLHKEYFTDVLYYYVNILNKKVDNPDQRIADDLDNMCKIFSQIFAPVIISPFITAYYVWKVVQMTGYLGPVIILVFFVIATIVNQFLMSPVVNYVYKKEKCEGDFRFKHMQIRVNAESMAFYQSGATEMFKTNSKLFDLLQAQYKLAQRKYALTFSIKFYDYVGSILNYIILAIPIFTGVFNNLTPVQLSALISSNAFITIYLISCFTKLIDLSSLAAQNAGLAHRVAILFEVLKIQKSNQIPTFDSFSSYSDERFNIPETDQTAIALLHKETNEDNSRSSDSSNVAISVKNLTYRIPSSREILCQNLTFQLQSGINILVTGESGCGKSSLVRMITGLWPVTSGHIECNIHLGNKGMMCLPQKPYFTNGSLLQQIIYPDREETFNYDPVVQDEIFQYLEKIKLQCLVSRVGQLDKRLDWDWYNELSPGQQQRLCFARLFYHKPKFAALDESTSQINLEAEQVMYSLCKELNITLISIGHRRSLRRYHQIELHLDGNGGWKMEPINL